MAKVIKRSSLNMWHIQSNRIRTSPDLYSIICDELSTIKSKNEFIDYKVWQNPMSFWLSVEVWYDNWLKDKNNRGIIFQLHPLGVTKKDVVKIIKKNIKKHFSFIKI